MESKPFHSAGAVPGYLTTENLHVEYSIVIFTLMTAQTVVLLLITSACLRENYLFPLYYYSKHITCFSFL